MESAGLFACRDGASRWHRRRNHAHPNRPFAAENAPSVRLFCSRSRVFSIRRARRQGSTRPGRTATFRNGSTVDMLEKIENQIERFAPGFRDCVLARHVLSPGCAGIDGCESGRRRHQRRRDGCRPISVSPDGAPLRDVIAEDLSVLVVDAAGRGSARHVWVPCGETGAVATVMRLKIDAVENGDRDLKSQDASIAHGRPEGTPLQSALVGRLCYGG